MDVEREIDRLYQRPLAEFVEARTTLTKAARTEAPEEAKSIKKLPKPSVSAWAVNQLFWFEQPAFEAMMNAGEQVRSSQRKAMAGEGGLKELQAAMEDRASALEGLMRAAEIALVRCGHGAAVGTLRRVETTLSELANRGAPAWGTNPGRLASDVVATGFDLLAALAPSVPVAKKTVEPPPEAEAEPQEPTATDTAKESQRRAAIAAARREVAAAEENLAVQEAKAFGTSAEAATKRRLAVEVAAELEEARQAFEAAQERARWADGKLAKAEERANRAAADCERARQVLSASRARLESLEG